MMDVRVVGVSVRHCLVLMGVAVRLAGRVVGRVFVLMVFVVDVAVFMLQRLVLMLVFVTLCQMQPEADAHERRRHAERNRKSFLENHQGEDGSDERSEREIRTCASGPQVPQGQHETRQADPVTKQTNRTSGQHGGQPRKVRPGEKGKAQIHAARNQTLCGGDLDGITARDFPGEVVVNSPRNCGAPIF